MRDRLDFLPVSYDDVVSRGWAEVDFVYVTGDAYVDHPSFGVSIISRVLEAAGFRIAILSQPDYKSTADFKRFGRHHLGFLVTEESSTEESTTEELTTLLEEPSTEEFTTDVPVTEPVTQPVIAPIVPEEDFSLVEPTTYESEQEDPTKNSSYLYIVLFATAGIMAVVIGTVAFFVAKGYRGKNKKQKIVVEEKYRGK